METFDLFTNSLSKVYTNLSFKETGPEVYNNWGIFQTGLKYLPLAFRPMNGCKINVFTSNIMVLHHKKSQTLYIKLYTKLEKMYDTY